MVRFTSRNAGGNFPVLVHNDRSLRRRIKQSCFRPYGPVLGEVSPAGAAAG